MCALVRSPLMPVYVLTSLELGTQRGALTVAERSSPTVEFAKKELEKRYVFHLGIVWSIQWKFTVQPESRDGHLILQSGFRSSTVR